MRNPNGYNVRKLSGKRRKPYNARILLGYDVNDENMTANPKYLSLGYFRTRGEALDAIAKYRMSPSDYTAQEYTLNDIYEAWSAQKYPTISGTLMRSYINAYRYFSALKNRPFSSLRAADYEAVITEKNVPRTVRNLCRVVLSGLYKYAIKYDIAEKDYSSVVDFKINNEVKEMKTPFTADEIRELYARKDEPIIALILLCLFTGIRPAELVKIKRQDIDMDARIITGGVKTRAGKGRHIPIHKDIIPVVNGIVRNMEQSKSDGFTLDEKPLALWLYRARFKSAISAHTPYDTRHTFISICKRQKMDEYVLKRIVGHSVDDVTEKFYTHIDDKALVAELDKINFQSETYL